MAAALANPRRRLIRLAGTREALDRLAAARPLPPELPVEILDKASLAQRAPQEAATQGVLLEAAPLPPLDLAEAGLEQPGPALVLLLDQVEDPRNVGAILRAAAAFGARAVITQDRHSPPETGALAKAASGALEMLPWIRATNLADALSRLAEMGYWSVGLDADAGMPVEEVDLGERLVLALGAEGTGLRPRIRKSCDVLARIPLAPADPAIDSLNVSAAAAVALYAAGRSLRR